MTWENKANEDKPKLDITPQNPGKKIEQNRTKQNKTRQNKTKQNRTKQNKTKQNQKKYKAVK